MRIRALLIASLPALQACSTQAGPPSDPSWIRERIAQLEQLAPGNPPREIYRFQDTGRTVYYVTPTCCDIPSELYDEKGALICYPTGGFAGRDKRCPEFALPSDAQTVWRDARQRPAPR
jgi:hypothetical protein